LQTFKAGLFGAFLLCTIFESAFAGPFKPLLSHFGLPAHCPELSGESFSDNLEFFYMSRRGSLSRGAHYEYPVSRAQLDLLYSVFHLNSSPEVSREALKLVQADPRLTELHAIIAQTSLPLGIRFGSYGDILEVLGLDLMRQIYPSDKYFIAGSIEYFDPMTRRTKGELDLVIGLLENCQVVAVGEVKSNPASIRRAGGAIDQLEAFAEFLKTQKEYESLQSLRNSFIDDLKDFNKLDAKNLHELWRCQALLEAS
jgi:hypothetical protein